MALRRLSLGTPIIRPLHFLTLPPDIRALIFTHLFMNQASDFVSPYKDGFILLAPKATSGRQTIGLAPKHISLPTSVLYVCRQVNREATESLFQSNILSTSFWAIERAAMSDDSAIPDVHPALRLDLVTVFETTLLAMPWYLMPYHSSLLKLAHCVTRMTRLKVLRVGVAEYQSMEEGAGRIHAWDLRFISVLEAFVNAVPKGAHVYVMNGEETGVELPGTLVVEKTLVEMIVNGRAMDVVAQMQEGQNFETDGGGDTGGGEGSDGDVF